MGDIVERNDSLVYPVDERANAAQSNTFLSQIREKGKKNSATKTLTKSVRLFKRHCPKATQQNQKYN
jgi:hypothetical protein